MSSNKPVDMKLYEKIAKQIKAKYPKSSAYRSGLLVKEYKLKFAEKYGKRKKPYTGQKGKGSLSRWFKENWTNQRGEVGYKKKGDVYRPNKRITKDTPKTFKEISKKDLKKAQKEKKEKGRVKKF
tara:strand:+ start:484 stop:858 length:375 start_codon:yes stop_codon:yes gene_type:complete